MLKPCNDKFISINIINTIAYYNFDQCKSEGYTTDLCNSNFENTINAIIAYIRITGDYINSGCIYNHIVNKKQNPILWILFAIGTIKA